MGQPRKDLSPGQCFGSFEVIQSIMKFGKCCSVVKCIHCGRTTTKQNSYLRSKSLAKCFCQRKIVLNQGDRYGKLTVIKNLPSENGQSMVLVRCDCGKIFKTQSSFVKKGYIISCKCAKKTRDGETYKNGHTTPLYNLYLAIKRRCYKSSDNGFKYYGSRGISMCSEWKTDFRNFLKWATENGYRKGLSIERIDNNGNYCPENCKWIPRSEQSKNRRGVVYTEYKGQRKITSDWLRTLGICKTYYYNRRRKGLQPIEIFEEFSKKLNTPDKR